MLKPQLEAAIKRKQGAVLRMVDIRSWGSEAARQHRISGIPQLWLYDGTTLVTRDASKVMDWLSR